MWKLKWIWDTLSKTSFILQSWRQPDALNSISTSIAWKLTKFFVHSSSYFSSTTSYRGEDLQREEKTHWMRSSLSKNLLQPSLNTNFASLLCAQIVYPPLDRGGIVILRSMCARIINTKRHYVTLCHAFGVINLLKTTIKLSMCTFAYSKTVWEEYLIVITFFLQLEKKCERQAKLQQEPRLHCIRDGKNKRLVHWMQSPGIIVRVCVHVISQSAFLFSWNKQRN